MSASPISDAKATAAATETNDEPRILCDELHPDVDPSKCTMEAMLKKEQEDKEDNNEDNKEQDKEDNKACEDGNVSIKVGPGCMINGRMDDGPKRFRASLCTDTGILRLDAEDQDKHFAFWAEINVDRLSNLCKRQKTEDKDEDKDENNEADKSVEIDPTDTTTQAAED